MFSRTSTPQAATQTPQVSLWHQVYFTATRKRRTLVCGLALCCATAFMKPLLFSEPEQLVQVAIFDGDYAADTLLEASMWHLADFPAHLAPKSPLDLSANAPPGRLAHNVVAGQPVTSNIVTSASTHDLRDGDVLVVIPPHPDAPFPPVTPGDKVLVTVMGQSLDGLSAGRPRSWTAYVARSQPSSSASNDILVNNEGKPPLHLKISQTFLNDSSTASAPGLIRVALIP